MNEEEKVQASSLYTYLVPVLVFLVVLVLTYLERSNGTIVITLGLITALSAVVRIKTISEITFLLILFVSAPIIQTMVWTWIESYGNSITTKSFLYITIIFTISVVVIYKVKLIVTVKEKSLNLYIFSSLVLSMVCFYFKNLPSLIYFLVAIIAIPAIIMCTIRSVSEIDMVDGEYNKQLNNFAKIYLNYMLLLFYLFEAKINIEHYSSI